MHLELGPISPTLPTDSPNVRAAADALPRAGIAVSLSGNGRRLLWCKPIFASVISGVPTMYGVSAGDAISVPEADTAIRGAIREGAAVAKAEGSIPSFTHSQLTRLLIVTG